MRKLGKLDEKGYTFTESIFQLIIMAVFVQFLLFFFIWKGTIEEQYSYYTSREWELFSADLQYLLSEVSEIQLPFRNHLQMNTVQGVIDIDQSGTVIRKRVRSEGHIPLLTSVCSVNFKFDGTELIATVTMVDHSVKVRGFAVGLYPE